jgi:serine/threonine protein kinase
VTTPTDDDDRVTERPAPSRPSTLASAILPGPVQPEETLLDVTRGDERYEIGKMLGIGGMGEVYLCQDRQIGRSIAMKVIDERRMHVPERRKRFVSEARVQGRLQHPSIVPVYDLDRNARGVDYFTMKRVSGNTLEFVIETSSPATS